MSLLAERKVFGYEAINILLLRSKENGTDIRIGPRSWIQSSKTSAMVCDRLLKRPAFTVVAVITIALGIGVNTAIFSVVNAVLLRPLPYDDPSRLISFRSNQSAPDLVDVEAQSKTFSRLGGMVMQPLAYTAGSEPVQFQIGQVTGGFFETLGVKPERGRFITSEDDKNGAPFVVVLSHNLWVKQFNSDEQILGKAIPLSGDMYTIIGVMPATFVTPRDNTEAWTPVHVSNPVAANFRGVHFLRTYGRLAPGVNIEQARTEMKVIDAKPRRTISRRQQESQHSPVSVA